MFQDDLFTILSEEKTDHMADIAIRINSGHPIFSGHFPGDAITPGVCIVQMAVDLFSHLMREEYRLLRAKNVKFLRLIRPDEHETVRYHLSWEAAGDAMFSVKAVVDNDKASFTKMSIQLVKA